MTELERNRIMAQEEHQKKHTTVYEQGNLPEFGVERNNRFDSEQTLGGLDGA
jgi:hypothetical protein